MKSSGGVRIQKSGSSPWVQTWALRPLVATVHSAGQDVLEHRPTLLGGSFELSVMEIFPSGIFYKRLASDLMDLETPISSMSWGCAAEKLDPRPSSSYYQDPPSLMPT